MVDMKKIALFAAGTLFGSAGFKLLSSSDAKKVYTQTTAAVLRMKDSTMETVSKVQEQAGDILEDAKAINEVQKHTYIQYLHLRLQSDASHGSKTLSHEELAEQ